MFKVTEEFDRKLYSSNDRQIEAPSIDVEVLCVYKNEIEKALKGISKDKSGGADVLSMT